MDNLRFPLFIALGACMFLLYQAWQKDYAQTAITKSPMVQTEEIRQRALNDESDVPVATTEEYDDTVQIEDDLAAVGNKKIIRVTTDVLDLEIDTKGGVIGKLNLTQFAQELPKEGEAEAFRLLNDELPYRFRVEGGLTASQGDSASHKVQYTAAKSQYTLADGSNQLQVALTMQGAKGTVFTKTFTFQRGSYEVDVQHTLNNQSNSLWVGSQYGQLVRTEATNVEEPPFINTFNGAALYVAEKDEKHKFKKFDFDDLQDEKVAIRSEGGWAAMVQHYFFGAIIPPQEQAHRYTAFAKANGNYVSRFVSPVMEVNSGETANFNSRMYLGPKLQDELGDIAPGLELTIDYGLFTVISKPLFWVLNKLHDLVGNWGLAIILITVLVKLAFYKVSQAQYRSMAKMKKFTPRIQQLRERHKDDRQKMQQAMMELYKKEKFNPLGGCLPMLVQIPVFMGLYWVLLESVELRHAPFFLWINDLTAADPYFVLPVLMGAVMILQQRMSSASMTMDPIQQKMMNIMPVMFAVFFAFFPAGLVLYWFMNTLLGILQQWWINRQMEKETA